MHWLPASLPAWLPAWLPACLPCLPGGLPDCLTASLPPARSLLLPSSRFFSLRRRIRGANSPPEHLARSPTPLALYLPFTRSLTLVLAPPLCSFSLSRGSPGRVSLCAVHPRFMSTRSRVSYMRRPCPRSTGSHSLSRDLLSRALLRAPSGQSSHVFLSRNIPSSRISVSLHLVLDAISTAEFLPRI